MKQPNCDIAVVGMAGFFPDAPDLRTFWRNIIHKKNGIEEVPPHRWDWQRYFHPDHSAQDKINSKWGAFLPDILFDPLTFGIPPKSLEFIEISQLLILESTRLALSDAGYMDRSFDKERTSVYIGTGAGEGDLGQKYSFRSQLPNYFGDSSEAILKGLDSDLPEWNEDTFTGIIMNIAAGRVASRFDLGGTNCTIDAACASALSALRIGIMELKAHESDMVIVGGADMLMSPYAYSCFSRIGALSPRGRSIPFDSEADGIVLGEAVATLILKRLDDAQKDGDKVYAVIKSIGTSSDGKTKGLTAPRAEGQVLALDRAYALASVDPSTVELVEAHGTSTKAGDQAEARALNDFFGQKGKGERTCAVGSVKSMIGHAKTAAGIAGLFKAILALHHKVLPPTLGIEHPLPELNETGHPVYLNSEARPWIGSADHPRRAGVSAFGFGGTNFHAVLEEHIPAESPASVTAALSDWDTELVVITGESRAHVLDRARAIQTSLKNGTDAPLKDLAFTLATHHPTDTPARLALVARSREDLETKLANAMARLVETDTKEIWTPSGIYYSEKPLAGDQKIAFIFPGQGSQYPGMGKDLAMQFPRVREVFERFDAYLEDRLSRPLSSFIFPPRPFSPEVRKADEASLTQTFVAQPAMGAMDSAVFRLLTDMGIRPHMTAGHSYGEYAALFAAGVMDEEALSNISEARGRFILESAHPEPGTMAAVKAPEQEVAGCLSGLSSVWIANLNSPEQTVISGTRDGVARALETLKKKGFAARSIPVACAFHSPIVKGAREKLTAFFKDVEFRSPTLPVFSNTTAMVFPENPTDIRKILGDQLVSPVRFVEDIRAMYDAGARIFVEVGAGSVLTNLIGTILGDLDHKAMCTDTKGVDGLTQLQHALAQLTALGLAPKLDTLYSGRDCRQLDLARPGQGSHLPAPSKAAYYIGYGGVRPVNENVREPCQPRPVCFMDKRETTKPLDPENKTEAIKNRDINQRFNTCGDIMKHKAYHIKKPFHDGSNDLVFTKFQDLMSDYLETQRAVMLSYLDSENIH